MNLNIYFQVCGVVILLLIMVMFSKRSVLDIPSFTAYRNLLISVFVCVCLDIESIFALNMADYEKSIFTAVVCRLYLISIAIVAYFILKYTICQMEDQIKHIKPTLWIVRIIIVAYMLLSLFMPVLYHVERNGIYTYGAYVILTYFVAVLIVAICIVYLVSLWRHMKSEKSRSVAFVLFCLCMATAIQFFNNELLLISFSLSVAMMYMYIYLENPNDYIDKVSGIFNLDAADIFLNNRLEKNDHINFITIEITGIKFINETFGSELGNELLKTVGQFLASINDTFAFRMSGAVFSVAFFGSEKKFNQIVHTIEQRFKENFSILDIDTVLPVRYCIFKHNNIKLSIPEKIELIRYFMNDKEIKETDGKIIIDETAIQERFNKQKIEKALNDAINNGEVIVNYQPIYNNKLDKFTSAEALMRIKDKDGKFIPPDIFIPIAEKNGLIIKLGMNLFEQVCELIQKNDLQNTSLKYIEVNLSVIQCMQQDLADKLLMTMKKYDVPPSFINFEITETAASNSESTLLSNMKKLLGENSSFSLDDYGSGYSNINYVLDLPISLIKYDKNMIWSYFDNEKGRVILNYTVNMTKELNLKSLAEGVETKEQCEQIKQLGIEYTQGFYFSKPLPPDEFVKKIKEK
jgi:EAL domain-containing protein (putative c-di-GMP-specific phosphodiesterase class I)/GGDEF domain-containing protein